MESKEHIQQLKDRINHNGSIEHDIMALANTIKRLVNNFDEGSIPPNELNLINEDMTKIANRYRETNKQEF